MERHMEAVPIPNLNVSEKGDQRGNEKGIPLNPVVSTPKGA